MSQGQRFFASLLTGGLVACLLAPHAVHAQDATWKGTTSGQWTVGTNWSSTPNVPTGTATFTTGAATAFIANSSGAVNIGSLVFTNVPSAPAYTFGINKNFFINGAGIANNSTSTQTFNVNDILAFQSGSANSGSGAVRFNVASTGSLYLLNSSTGGNATINNNLGTLAFGNSSTAGSATITNTSNSSASGGFAYFGSGSTAGNAKIINNGYLRFFDNSTAGNAAIINNLGLQFSDSSTAGSAIITGSRGVEFSNNSSAGNATIATQDTVFFKNSSTAGTAAIKNSFIAIFSDNSTAASATIINNSFLAFAGLSTAGNAAIANNTTGDFFKLQFGQNSTGGNAAITNGGAFSMVDFSLSTGPNADHKLSVGSLAGPGIFYLGANRLTIGGNNLSTVVSGVIGDCVVSLNRCNNLTLNGNPSTGGSLVKTGTGTLILSGANTYTGGTTINAGTLQLGNGGATGSILGNVVDNANFAINRSDAFIFGGSISGSGAFQQLGTGITTLTALESYSGLTTIGSGKLALSGAGNIASSSGVLANGAFDIAGVSATGTSVQSLSGTGSVALGAKMLTLTNASGDFAGSIGGPGGVTLTNGTQTLSGSNTYAGGTHVAGGTLQLGNGGATGSIVGNVLNNGNFAINRSDAFIFGAVISGSGAFQQLGTGTTTLSATNTYTGATLVLGGALTIAAGGSITSNVTNNSVFNNSGSVVGSVTNTGTFNNNANGSVSKGLTNAATVNASGGPINGAIANNAAGTFSVLGTVTSDGTFTNAASATLAISASGAYTLQGMLTNSGAVTVAGGGQLTATVGGITNNVGGTITVAAGGTVKDDLNNASLVNSAGTYLANVATNTGVVTNQTGGTWTGNLLSNVGTVTNQSGAAWVGSAANGPGGTLNNSGTWSGAVVNAGTFNNDAGATVTGLLTNTAGTTTNNGALNGGAVVSGGMLAGAGSVTNLTIANGATLAPGNGTPGSSMTVAGNLAFQSGALYLVVLNPATSSRANVTGTAGLNGSAGAAFLTGNYVAKQYTILTAVGGVSGTFGSFDTLNIPNGFKSSLSYDSNNAYLNLALNFIPPPGSGLNANQQSAANAIVGFFNANSGIPLVFGALTPAGLTQISGEVATGSQQTTFNAMNQFMGVMTDPFIAGRGEPVTSSSTAPQFADDETASAYASNGKPRSKSERDAYAAVYRKAPAIADPFIQRWSVWAAGYGGSQTTDGNTVLGSNNTRSSIGGVAVGADYRFSPHTLAGFAIAGGATNFSVNGLGSGRSDLFQAGAFVRHNVGAAYLTGALAYGWQDITTDRTVTVAGTDLLRAQFNANAFSGRVEGGYRFVTPWIGGVGITPYAAGQFVSFDLPAYAEQAIAGANTFALSYASKSVTDTRSELGLRTDKSFAMQNGIFTLRGRAAWAHDFNTDRAITPTFQTLPGASFVVNGAAPAHDSALVTASAEMKWLNGFALAGTFEGEFSNVTTSYAGKGVVRYAW